VRPDAHAACVTLRDLEEADLPHFFEHQLDTEASQMAAFPSRGWQAFLAHWHDNVLGSESVRKQTVVVDGEVAGNVLSWEQEGRRVLGYWLARGYWGRGIASAALAEFARLETVRPLYAHVAAENPASIRVLEKTGFQRTSEAFTGPDGVVEFLYRLDSEVD
jgi:RimJ/RimL family protein N-acetyltransferase